jgi:hypothetical protein
VPVKNERNGLTMAILIVSAEDFDANPAEYRNRPRITKVVVVDRDSFLEFSRMKSATEADLINAKVAAMVRAGEISMEGHGVPVDELLLDELRGHAT